MPDGRWLRTICLVLHMPGAGIRHRLRPVSDGDRPYRSEQKFFRAGESTRAEGRFYSESPLSLAFFAVWKAEKICLSVDFAHLFLSIKIIALATICNIMKY